MYLKLLCFIVLTSLPTLSYARGECPKEVVDRAHQESRLLIQDGPLTAKTKPFTKVQYVHTPWDSYSQTVIDTDRLGGFGVSKPGSPSQHLLEYELKVSAPRAYMGFGAKPVREVLEFANYHCRRTSEFAGTYNWDRSMQMWVNAKGIGLRVITPENSALAQVSTFKLEFFESAAMFSRNTTVENDLIIVDGNLVTVPAEKPTMKQIFEGLGASIAQNEWIESLPPQEAVDYLIQSLPATPKWQNLLWLAPRLENLRQKNPVVIQRIFSDVGVLANRQLLGYAVQTSVRFIDEMYADELTRRRLAAANFVIQVVSAENALLTLGFIKQISQNLEGADPRHARNITAIIAKINEISNLTAETRTALYELVATLTANVEKRVQKNMRLMEADGFNGNSERYRERHNSVLEDQELIKKLSSLTSPAKNDGK